MGNRRLKISVEKANHINLQLVVLEELGRNPMHSHQLRELIEGMGGEYYPIISVLKKAKLISAKRDGRDWVYSLNSKKVKKVLKVRNQSSITYSISLGNPSEKPIFYCRVKSPMYTLRR